MRPQNKRLRHFSAAKLSNKYHGLHSNETRLDLRKVALKWSFSSEKT